jgi:type II restriction/modification system DNA methylase subunit YeeA
MQWAEFKKKWSRYQGKETSAYQGHFDDLCRLLGQPTPTEADPSGSDFFCFQKRVVKDLELFDLEHPDSGDPTERGFADVWKKGCFGWEYKGKKKNLDEAYKQLLRYREALLNPPLLVVCDFDRYIVRTNFNGTVQETHEFTNDQIDRPQNLRILRSLFADPEYLKPQRTTAQVTEKLAAQIAAIARLLQGRESVELANAKTREQVRVAQKQNLRIARFLNRIVFCLFAEDTGLLPARLFSEVTKAGIEDPRFFAERLEELFRVMAKGGSFGTHKIRHFNGHLFEEATVFELTGEEIGKLAEAAEADWQFIEPSIMGTLFERALDEGQRAQLGAHYTSEADIKTLVEPVLMQPLRREWGQIKGELAAAYTKAKGTPAERSRLAGFQKKIASTVVLDPACGSGNFLYVSLQLLLSLEKEVITFATQLGLSLKPQVSVQQLKAIEINPYAYELAQVSVQIGYLQWRRDNGFDNDRTPVLQNLDGFENKDALLHETFRKKPKNLKEARRQEHHHSQDELFKVYVERAWPECDVIVGNPPFLGGSKLWEELGRDYQAALWQVFKGRVPGFADLCCYWFEKARYQIQEDRCKRAGLLATQAIRGGANREVLTRVKETGEIFFAESDRDWILGGANVHVSMIGFDKGIETGRKLDGRAVCTINANLSATADITKAIALRTNIGVGYMGSSKKAPFDIPEFEALAMLLEPNATGKPNSDVIRPWVNGQDITRRWSGFWIIDFPPGMSVEAAAGFELPYQYAEANVKPERAKNKRAAYRERWWVHAEPRPEMRSRLTNCARFIVTPTVSKHRVFVWERHPFLPDQQLIAFASDDDYIFGIAHSSFHETWSLAQGTQVRERESGFRYTPTTCFETFPFPFLDDLIPPASEALPGPQSSSEPDRTYAENLAAKNYYVGMEDPPPYSAGTTTPGELRIAIAAAAKDLNELRERWLNPPEWTIERVLEFPGSVNGPWAKYVVAPDANGVGTVRYPRLEARDPECAAKLQKRTLTNLYNERPTWLDLAHKKLDAAVAAAYGWPADLTDEQILEKLLALNLERAAEEAKAQTSPRRKSAQRDKAEHEMI